jgi:hypothetical protein
MSKVVKPEYIEERIATRENVWDMVTYVNKQLRESRIKDDKSIDVIGWSVLSDEVKNNLIAIYVDENWVITDIDEDTKNFKVPDSSNSGMGDQHG